jgi:hypothetical protein
MHHACNPLNASPIGIEWLVHAVILRQHSAMDALGNQLGMGCLQGGPVVIMRRLHVDAAYAGVLGILPEMRHHFAGLELADSLSTNAHKWLLTTFDCSCMWLRDAQYVRAALSLLPAYLRSRGNDHDYKAGRPCPGVWHRTHQLQAACKFVPGGMFRACYLPFYGQHC